MCHKSRIITHRCNTCTVRNDYYYYQKIAFVYVVRNKHPVVANAICTYEQYTYIRNRGTDEWELRTGNNSSFHSRTENIFFAGKFNRIPCSVKIFIQSHMSNVYAVHFSGNGIQMKMIDNHELTKSQKASYQKSCAIYLHMLSHLHSKTKKLSLLFPFSNIFAYWCRSFWVWFKLVWFSFKCDISKVTFFFI